MVSALVVSTLRGLGLDVIDLGLSTPTVELAVTGEKAAGGIILTASHNAQEWNALKLFNHEGEFVSAQEGAAILEKAQKEDFVFATVDRLGDYRLSTDWLQRHVDAVVGYPLVDVAAIRGRKFKVVA